MCLVTINYRFLTVLFQGISNAIFTDRVHICALVAIYDAISLRKFFNKLAIVNISFYLKSTQVSSRGILDDEHRTPHLL